MSYAQNKPNIPNLEMSCGSNQKSGSSTSAPPSADKQNPDKGMIYIKVAFHFILPTKDISYDYTFGVPPIPISYTGPGNFTETSDGFGGSYNGFQFAEDMINAANAGLLTTLFVRYKILHWVVVITTQLLNYRLGIC